MSEWQEYVLVDIIDQFIDYRGKTPKKSSSGIPLITAKIVKSGKIIEPTEFISEENYSSWMTRGFPQVNDIVLTTEAPLGEIALIKDAHVALGQRLITLRGNPSLVSNPFLKYYFQNSVGQHELQSRASGTTVFGIKASVLREVPVFLPPLPEQKAIASVLSSLDDKIDLLQRQNITLEAMAETLFRQWFVEEAQEDWETTTLGNIADINPKYRLKKGPKSTYLEMKGLDTVSSIPSGWYKREFTSGMKFQNGDTLLARITPCLENGKTCFVSFLQEDETGWGSTEYIVIRMKEPFHPYISYIIAKNEGFREFAVGSMSGSSGRQRANASVVSEYIASIPPPGIITRMNEQLESISSKLRNNANQIEVLQNLRDTLLPKLIGGEVEVQFDD